MVLSFALTYTLPAKRKIKAETAVSTCYGYSPCKACSNCSRCKYCSAGGSCGVCGAKAANKINTLSGKAATEKKTAVYSGQCKALTKKGARCKRSGSGTGFCWQHNK